MKFDIIVADPPWNFGDPLKNMKMKTKRSAISQYKTMGLADINRLPVKQLINPKGAVLALWVPSSMIKDGIHVMESWGFTLKSTFVWVKLKKDFAKEKDWNNSTRVGMGRLFRQAHEIALIGTFKSPYSNLQNKSQRSVCFDLNVSHSTKPETLQDRLDLMFPSASKLELFARRHRQGWTCLGDQLNNTDIDLMLNNLITL